MYKIHYRPKGCSTIFHFRHTFSYRYYAAPVFLYAVSHYHLETGEWLQHGQPRITIYDAKSALPHRTQSFNECSPKCLSATVRSLHCVYLISISIVTVAIIGYRSSSLYHAISTDGFESDARAGDNFHRQMKPEQIKYFLRSSVRLGITLR